MLEELKYALLNLHNIDLISGFTQFTITDYNIWAIYHNITVEGYDDKILIYYDDNSSIMGVLKKLQYLDKQNTLRIFKSVSLAIEDLNYLVRAAKDIRLELFHYFLSKLNELKLKYGKLDYKFINNFSSEELTIYCNLSAIELNDNKLDYQINIIFINDNTCKMRFIPENVLWNENKEYPEIHINNILDYLKRLNCFSYKDIPLKEY